MATVDFGAQVKLEWLDLPPGSTASLEITQPDGMPLTLTPTGTPPTATFTPALAGRHLARWSASSGEVVTDLVDVWPVDPRFLVSVDDMKNGLNAGNRMTPDDVQDLRLYIAAATPVIEDIVGPVLLQSRELTTTGGRPSVALPTFAAAVVESVSVNGQTLSDDQWFSEHGVVYPAAAIFAPGQVVIGYTTGSGLIPPNVRLGARELIRHWWQIGKQSIGGAVRGQEYQADAFTPSGFAVPRRVIELCAPHQQVGGFA